MIPLHGIWGDGTERIKVYDNTAIYIATTMKPKTWLNRVFLRKIEYLVDDMWICEAAYRDNSDKIVSWGKTILELSSEWMYQKASDNQTLAWKRFSTE